MGRSEDDGFILIPRHCHNDQYESQKGHQPDALDKHISQLDLFIENLSDSLWTLNTFVHANPELAFKEYKTRDALVDFIRSQESWKVSSAVYGLETAWSAIYERGENGPVVSFNAEMDALPDIGHACGHNLIAISALAAGLATAQIMRKYDLPGKVLIFGTPGEEGIGGGKKRLLQAGAYKDVDISLISHPGIPNNSPLVRTTAFARVEVQYFGRAAHAAKSPWLGINALDAIVIAYNALSALRQQTMGSDVIGMSITNGGAAPNIIHSYTAGLCVIRAASVARLTELREKVKACFRAGAEATGARVEITVTPGYADHVPNRILAASYTKYWNALPDVPDPAIPPADQFTYVKASTDQGNISYAMPSLNASFAIPPGPEGGFNHSPDFEKASGTKAAFERALRVGKALAGTAVDVLTIPGLLNEVKEQWRRDMESAKNAVLDAS